MHGRPVGADHVPGRVLLRERGALGRQRPVRGRVLLPRRFRVCREPDDDMPGGIVLRRGRVGGHLLHGAPLLPAAGPVGRNNVPGRVILCHHGPERRQRRVPGWLFLHERLKPGAGGTMRRRILLPSSVRRPDSVPRWHAVRGARHDGTRAVHARLVLRRRGAQHGFGHVPGGLLLSRGLVLGARHCVRRGHLLSDGRVHVYAMRGRPVLL